MCACVCLYSSMCACECVPGHSWVMGAVFGIDTVMTPVLSTHVTELLYGTALRSSLYQEGLMWNTPSPLFTLFHSRQAHSSQIHSIHSFNHYYKLVCLRLVIIRDQLIYQSAQAFPRPHPHPRPSPHHPSSRSLFSASKQSLLKERDIRYESFTLRDNR